MCLWCLVPGDWKGKDGAVAEEGTKFQSVLTEWGLSSCEQHIVPTPEQPWEESLAGLSHRGERPWSELSYQAQVQRRETWNALSNRTEEGGQQ